ncbi:hypothetical protein KI809_14515 [Geobacter pelophilus]|uniref:Uncharacterized protein n=1 Tax=Geoanaerobacter pelophilus TaxID=60036 RepID=A0AAW4L3Q1_9BACT|nr:hypothetical protein [Geoanaerobacter pelophilus]MBT0665518.1 hypothetical protein [Geoanaerobacter pelophilus]
MKSEVIDKNDAAQELAKKCPHQVSCLKTGQCGERSLCTVRRCVGDNVLFLEGNVPFVCPYLLPFGYGHLCTCPVHAELYKSEPRIAGPAGSKSPKKHKPASDP